MSCAVPADVDEAQLADLVERFYDKVRADPLLGPVFDPLVDDWDAHKVMMTSFWATVVLRTGHYRGNPLAKHLPLAIGNAHFERWLALWRDTAGEVFGTRSGAFLLLAGYAERIGRGLRVGIGLAVPPRVAAAAVRVPPVASAGPRLRGSRPPPAVSAPPAERSQPAPTGH